MLTGQQHQVAYQHVRGDGDRVLDHAAFVTLHLGHFQRLLLGGHVLVNDADAAFLGHRNRQTRLGDGIHCSGDQGQIQADVTGEASGQGNVTWQNGGVGRHEENVVESVGLLDDAHLAFL
ncbi:hypothetical protein D3C85_1324800 [compost metagenome]